MFDSHIEREQIRKIGRVLDLHDTPFIMGLASGTSEDFERFSCDIIQELRISPERVHRLELGKIGTPNYKGSCSDQLINLCRPIIDGSSSNEVHVILVLGFAEMFPPETDIAGSFPVHHDCQSIQQDFCGAGTGIAEKHRQGHCPRFVVVTHLPHSQQDPRVDVLLLDAMNSIFNQFRVRLGERA